MTCPHCGQRTGIAADPTLTDDERRAAVELARIDADRYGPPPAAPGTAFGYDPDLALIGGAAVAALALGAAVKSAITAVADERADRSSRPELPRAYARERTAPPIVPEPSKEPEPAPPPADTPRFLK